MKPLILSIAMYLTATPAFADKYEIRITNNIHILCTNKDVADMLDSTIKRLSTPPDFYVGMSDQGVIEIQNRVNHANIKLQPSVGCILVDQPERLGF